MISSTVSTIIIFLVSLSVLNEQTSAWVLTSTPVKLNNMPTSIPTSNSWRMDVEMPPMYASTVGLSLGKHFKISQQELQKTQKKQQKSSYMPFYKWQLDYFQNHLTNFREIAQPHPEFASVISKKTSVMTRWFASDEYRLIRMTYMDAGEQTQIFTSVCYPRNNLPILGSGLLQCGGKRICICDYQPLEDSHETVADLFLKPIQDQYSSLQEEMSDRFFDQNKFFSSNTLIGRYPMNEESAITEEVLPAYQSFVKTHVELTRTSCSSIETPLNVLKLHSDYDTHVASRDPAIHMLTGIFGAELATDIVYKSLFPFAQRE